MTDDSGAPKQPGKGWGPLFRGELGIYTLLLNLGVALHATHIFIITTVMPTVIRDIGGLGLYAWPTMMYLVGTIVGASSGAAVRAGLGRRRGYALGTLIFMAGAAGCGMAPTMPMLIGAHLLQGFGGGLILSQSMALVGELFGGVLRTRALALITTTWSVASLFGPLLGGFFGQIDWWRGAFWSMVVLTLAAALLAWRAIPRDATDSPGVRLPYRRLLLIAVGVVCVGVTGQVDTWAERLPLFVLSIALLWWAIWLDRRSSAAMFPSRVFSLFSAVGTAYWLNFCVAITHIGTSLFLPLSLFKLHGVEPLWVGVFNTIMSIAWTLGSLIVAGWAGARRRRLAMVGGMVLAAAANVALAIWIDTATVWALGIFVTVLGIGIGMTNVHTNAFTMAIADPGEETVTASALPAVRSLGIAFGAAAMGFVANAAGLASGNSVDIPVAVVADAMGWVFAVNTVLPVLAALLAIRMMKLAAGRPVDY